MSDTNTRLNIDISLPSAKAERLSRLRPDEPCDHPGCLHHVTHPCEGCGRIAGRWPEETGPASEEPERPARWILVSSGDFKDLGDLQGYVDRWDMGVDAILDDVSTDRKLHEKAEQAKQNKENTQ